MKFLGPTPHSRLNEAGGVVLLSLGVFVSLSLVSFYPHDPSWNTATTARPRNLMGYPGAHLADLCYQVIGLASPVIPVMIFLLGWKWIRSQEIHAAFAKVAGAVMLLLSACALAGLGPEWRLFDGSIAFGGLLGVVLADYLRDRLNYLGALLLCATSLLISLYLISTFSVKVLESWLSGPIAVGRALGVWWKKYSEARRRRRAEKAARKPKKEKQPVIQAQPLPERPPLSLRDPILPQEPEPAEEIPIRTLEDLEPARQPDQLEVVAIAESVPEPEPAPRPNARARSKTPPKAAFRLPSTDLLNEPPGRNPYDEQELKEIAVRIKSKFEEFNVLGTVVQINPGPVVTTFEFKPEAGVKYTRVTALTEDLCLGLQAESILIERIPGKPTVGIEVPNSRREVISLRQVLESDEFQNSTSRLTITLGKDINGRIKVAALDSMPHLLIAGSTGSGKSVMLNALIMSILYKSTPEEVRMIMVDPKRLELGLYEGVPHLLTPVITDAKKATYALRNAVLEMERRLKLLASRGVRNIEQYNRKIRQLANEPRSLFSDETEVEVEELETLPYILILIDELADLMMLERANVEESVTRLAQMARAVGMHLVLATQRPSVDVITGLIKANFPARISFRVATRVDSRTILDEMGAEHLLGKGDMLFQPPGSSRKTRVHGAFVTENEINQVVEFWKAQAQPAYDETFLVAPPSDDDEEAAEFDGEEDPMYRDAVRVVLELGKASTSTLQRRLRLGYGRAARILDMMYRDGIIGPPDGSRPRDVLKRPDWLEEIEVR